MATPLRRKRGGQARKFRFTTAHWARLLAEHNGEHPHAAHLRAGIELQRSLLTTNRDQMRSDEMIRSVSSR